MKLNFNQFDDGGYVDSAGENVSKPLAPTPLAAQESGLIGAASMASQAKATETRMAGMASPSALAAKESGLIGATSIATRMKAMGASAPSASTGTAKSAKAKAPVDKSNYDRSIKVSQSTVDSVKRAGAYGSQKNAKEGMPGYYGSELNPKAPASAEYKEAVKRVYPNPAKEPKAAAPKAAPKNYGGAAAEKYKAEEKAAKNKSAFPPILPAPSKPTTAPKPNSAATMPPLMTPTSPKNAEKKAATPAKIKVSQATVDAVKKAGKEKSIGATQYKGVSPEYKEAVRRIYQSPAKPKAKAKSGGGGGGKASSAVK